MENGSGVNGKAPKVDVAMLGARLHYAVPKLLYREQLLGTFFTDVFLPDSDLRRALSLRRMLPDPVRRMLQRTDRELDRNNVCAFNRFGIRYALTCRWTLDSDQRSRLYLEAAQEFSKLILCHGLSPCQALYVFDCAAKELLEYAHRSGRRSILEQTIAPKAIVARLIQEELNLWPGWEPKTRTDGLSIMAQREQREWEMADFILAPSQFVLDSLVQLGVPRRKCRLVPYAISLEDYVPKQKTHQGKLHVLFAGAVELRKGAPYLLEALRLLESRSIEAKFAGCVALDSRVLRPYERWVKILGPLPRAEMRTLYDWADVLVFPSICEGSAIVTYEALAKGTPVVTTENAGSAVLDGIDGLIVPIRDVEVLAATIESLAREPELLKYLRQNAIKGRRRLGLEAYQMRLRDRILEACVA